MLNDPPHALLNTPTVTAPLDPWDEVSIWTSKAWDEVSYNRKNIRCWCQQVRQADTTCTRFFPQLKASATAV